MLCGFGGALLSGCGGGAANAGPTVPTPSWGGQILFNRGSDLYIINADGTGERKVLSNVLSGRLSPDGSKIVYNSFGTGDDANNVDVYTISSSGDSSTKKRLTTDPNSDNSPVWNSDGTKLAFCSRRLPNPSGNPNTDIFTMNADGTNQQVLANTNGNECPADWSSNNSFLTFSSNKATGEQDSLFVIGSDGKNERLLDSTGGNGSFTRDSQSIIYSSNGSALLSIDVNGQNKRTLFSADDLGSVGAPSVSPNGQFVAFVAVKDFKQNIYIAKFDGSERRLLVSNGTTPFWGGR